MILLKVIDDWTRGGSRGPSRPNQSLSPEHTELRIPAEGLGLAHKPPGCQSPPLRRRMTVVLTSEGGLLDYLIQKIPWKSLAHAWNIARNQ